MEKLRNKIDSAIIGAKCRLMAKREGSDQLGVSQSLCKPPN